jgi:hypothetical protein
MSLYGTTSLYGQELYGNPTYLTELGTQTQAFNQAQESSIRKITGQLIINSHMQQFGRNVEDNSVLIGGATKERVAQSFISPVSFNLAEVQILARAGYSGNTDDIQMGVYIGTDISSATLVGSTTITAISNLNTQWNKGVFSNVLALSAGSTYWITAQNNLDTEETTYACLDYTTTGDFTGAKAIGTTWSVSTGTQYLMRTKSETEAQNDKIIEEVKSFNLVRDINAPTQTFIADLVNQDQKFAQGQSYSDYLQAGNVIKAFIGFDGADGVQYYQIFKGITENSPSTKSIAQMSAKCYMSKMLGDYTSSGVLGGLSYEEIIQVMAQRSGITELDLRTTGKTAPSVLSFANISTFNVADKARQATIDTMQFYNTDTLYTTERKKKTTTNNYLPKYYIRDDNFLIDGEVQVDTTKMINRITVTNDENGETTTDDSQLTVDDSQLTVGDYRTLGTVALTLGSTVASGTVGLTFSHGTIYGKPSIYMDWSSSGTTTRVIEDTRYCGNSSTYGSMAFTVYNKQYGIASGTTTITVNGCPISNAGATTVLAENQAQTSVESYGKYAQRVDNKILGNLADANYFTTELLQDRSIPQNIIKMNTRGIVDIYPDDVIAVYEPTRLKIQNLAITHMSQLQWNSHPAMFSSYIEAELRPYGIELSYLLTEDGGFLLQEDGNKILL